ncbi:MAG: PP2C family serine/threonine-protein phosphatase [Patescibacteria group bacterium]|nr:PP2C family serine/threonine-protein phosphatase [Patescibacteria group bacterium]
MLKIKSIYSQGTTKEVEDGLIINPPFFGVIDATSEPSHFIGKGLIFNGMSSGEMTRKIILETFYSAKGNDSLEEVILLANKKLVKLWQGSKITLNRSDLIGGAAFVFAKINKEKIEIIQGGDCFALWVKKSNKIEITRNQVYFHELEALKIISELMKKHKGDRKKMWLDLYKPLSQLRLRDNNKKTKTGFAILNGQPSLKECWQKIEIPIKSLKLLLLFSDGFVPFQKEDELAKETIKFYQKGGLNYILKKKREYEKKNRKRKLPSF